MSRTLKQRLTDAIQATMAAGQIVHRVEIDRRGKIVIVTAKGDYVEVPGTEPPTAGEIVL